jgi:hypothetical protein
MADIRHAIQITAPVEELFRLTATGSGFAQWWAEDVSEADGVAELGFFRKTTIYRLKLMEALPPNPSGAHIGHPRAEWLCLTGSEWSGTHIVFELQSDGAGTLLNFKHGGWAAETAYFVSCNTTWGALMFRLKAAAEGKGTGPLFLADGMKY